MAKSYKNKKKGSKFLLVSGLLVMAVAIVFAISMVQKNQETRSNASNDSCVKAGGTCAPIPAGANCSMMGQGWMNVSQTCNLAGSMCCRKGGTGPKVQCPAKCSNNFGCMKTSAYIGLGNCDNPDPTTVSYIKSASCPAISADVLAKLGTSGNNNACKTEVPCNRCSLNNGCQMAHFTGLGTCNTIKPNSTTYTTDQSCGKKNGAGGGNDNSCTSTKEVSCKRCSLNNGCQMARFIGLGTCDTIKPNSTTYTTDQSCGKKNGAGGGNDRACVNSR